MHVDMDDVNYSVLTYAASEKKTQWDLPYSTLVREKFWKQISCGGTMYFLWYVNGLLFRQELFVRKISQRTVPDSLMGGCHSFCCLP